MWFSDKIEQKCDKEDEIGHRISGSREGRAKETNVK